MKLWRIDADFLGPEGEPAGLLTYFSLAPRFDGRSDVLVGWNRDAYEVDVPELTREQASELVGRPWPTLPIEDLVAIARGQRQPAELGDWGPDEVVALASTDAAAPSPGLLDAKQQLQAVLERKGNSTARIAWERE